MERRYGKKIEAWMSDVKIFHDAVSTSLTEVRILVQTLEQLEEAWKRSVPIGDKKKVGTLENEVRGLCSTLADRTIRACQPMFELAKIEDAKMDSYDLLFNVISQRWDGKSQTGIRNTIEAYGRCSAMAASVGGCFGTSFHEVALRLTSGALTLVFLSAALQTRQPINVVDWKQVTVDWLAKFKAADSSVRDEFAERLFPRGNIAESDQHWFLLRAVLVKHPIMDLSQNESIRCKTELDREWLAVTARFQPLATTAHSLSQRKTTTVSTSSSFPAESISVESRALALLSDLLKARQPRPKWSEICELLGISRTTWGRMLQNDERLKNTWNLFFGEKPSPVSKRRRLKSGMRPMHDPDEPNDDLDFNDE